jgi:hypothetical protein
MFIRSSVEAVGKVYASTHTLALPWFQRAYAWSEVHVGRLIHDLGEAMGSPKKRYSLGHITLARGQDGNTASIVDGHQRSISLTMLFALLRDLLDAGDPVGARLHFLVEAPGNGWRLQPQPGIAPFFASYIQMRGGTLMEPDGDPMDLTPSERNILANRDHMRGMLCGIGEKGGRLRDLALFLMDDCVLIVDEVEDEEEARNLLQREEERGLSPHSSELAKVTILTAMPGAEQEEAAGLFEGVQTQLSADDVSSLLAHIRVLKLRRRSSRAVDSDLIQRFKLDKSGLLFLRNELMPRASWMVRIKRRQIGSGEQRGDIDRSLTMLEWIDHKMWMPAALHWLSMRGDEDPETAQFFQRLDRLTYLMKIASVDPTDQENRFIEVLAGIDRTDKIDDIAPLRIERPLLAAALENLRSRTFYIKRFHALVLRRISVHIDPARDPGPVDGENVTVEHVLPRKPEHSWRQEFPGNEVSNFCNRIGNLAFLSLEENNIAGNNDFIVKRLLLANAGGRFVLSAKAAEESEWKRDTIMRRGEQMITVLLEPWGLSAEA